MLNSLKLRRIRYIFFLLIVICLIMMASSLFVIAFVVPDSSTGRQSKRITRKNTVNRNPNPFVSTARFSSVEDNKQRESTSLREEEEVDPDVPAGIGGAEFFGGNQQKNEFYDPVAEKEAGRDFEVNTASYDRFSDVTIFDTNEVASLALSLQRMINLVLYSNDKKLKRIVQRNEKEINSKYEESSYESFSKINFASSLIWETPMMLSNSPVSNSNGSKVNPIDELILAKEFYEEIDLAIITGKQISDDVFEFSWELSLVWPTFWSPRVFLTGTSTCTLDRTSLLSSSNRENNSSKNIERAASVIRQIDKVFDTDARNSFSLVSILGKQIIPRFWDWYHIGMTPSAELLPRRTIVKKGGIVVYQIPPRLILAPTIIETGTRENRHAEMIPNHAFTCAIKTMGPNKKNYIPTTPVEVKIGRNIDKNDDSLRIKWSIPLSTQFQAVNINLPLPGDNPEDDEEESFPTCNYEWEQLRQVATIKYGGNVQDKEIPAIRQRLYEQVLKDGWRPKFDKNGKPQFFFLQNDVKACFVEGGFGMSVCDWRPKFAESNEIGIELVVDAT